MNTSDTGDASASGDGGIASSGWLSIKNRNITFLNVTIGRGPGRRRRRRGRLTARELDEIADELSGAVKEQLRDEQQKRIKPLPLRLSRTRRRDVENPVPGIIPEEDHERWNSEFVSDDLAPLIDAFARLPHRRLAILGEGGAGKTELARNLAIALLERRERRAKRPEEEQDEAERLPVAILLSLGDGELREERLDDWIASQLVDKYGLYVGDRALARDLVRTGRVLPVLDGLESWGGSTARTVSQLNEADRPVIVTCRVREYEEALTRTEGKGGRYHPVLLGAPVLEVLPVGSDETERHLRDMTPPRWADKWDRVFANMKEHPEGPLAEALSTPLMVWLAASIYADRAHDPDELIGLGDRAAVEERLLDQLIPAAFDEDADRARRYLGFLAFAMRHLATTKIAWWQLTRITPLPVTGGAFATAGGLLTGLGVMVGVGLGRAIEVGLELGPVAGIDAGLWAARDFGGVALGLGLVAAAAIGTAAWQAAKSPPEPVVMAWRRRRKSGPLLPRLTGGLRVGIIGASAFALAVMALFGFSAAWPVALVGLIVAPFASGIGVIPGLHTQTDTTRAVLPSGVLVQDRRAVLVNMLVSGLLAGLPAALAVELLVRPSDLPPPFAAAFTIGITIAVYRATQAAWAHFLVTRIWLACFRRLPLHLMKFLDGAFRDDNGRPVLRRVGGVYQFRHERHESRLAASVEPSGRAATLRRTGRTRTASVLLSMTVAAIAATGAVAGLLHGARGARCDERRPVASPLVQNRSGCVLRPSTSVFKNHLDKIDLDTGEPGHGGTEVLIGYRRKGGPAEIILNFHDISNASRVPGFVKIARDQPAGAAECRALLRNRAARVSRFNNADLGQGDRLCVKTDQGRIALVHVQEMMAAPNPRLVIAFQVWDR
ncbi:hypothetical protein ACFOY4_40990 [Actinomadura syzygii]|uniref:NACHT domain-containing protein n=1 Tax=Actinomadura syzygii TaxID=1427538 RepID=A0A5D0TM42_9ACTN|nr:hypothetical protein [Actinomadura syzygii]TYC07341.1 hypothetical protein FXF65_43060 [Actinomadura syzygii]